MGHIPQAWDGPPLTGAPCCGDCSGVPGAVEAIVEEALASAHAPGCPGGAVAAGDVEGGRLAEHVPKHERERAWVIFGKASVSDNVFDPRVIGPLEGVLCDILLQEVQPAVIPETPRAFTSGSVAAALCDHKPALICEQVIADPLAELVGLGGLGHRECLCCGGEAVALERQIVDGGTHRAGAGWRLANGIEGLGVPARVTWLAGLLAGAGQHQHQRHHISTVSACAAVGYFLVNRRMRSWLGVLARAGLTVAVIGWIWPQIAAESVLSHLSAVPWWGFVCPTALMLFNGLLQAVRTQLLLAAAGVQVRLWPLYGALLRAMFIGLVLPKGGGEVAKVALVGSLTGRTDAALAALLAARLLEFIPWTGLLLFGLAYGVGALDPLLGVTAVVFSVVFSTVVLLAVLGVHRGPSLAGRLPGRLGTFAVSAASSLISVRGRPDLVAWALLLMVPIALLNGLAIWTALRGNGIFLGYVDVLAIFTPAETLISLPVTISGVGVREGIFIRVLSDWGATDSQSVSAGLTRWAGELGRAAVGGVWWLLSREQKQEGVHY